jgi:phosphoribosylaminoimidazole (AIR) synthetase
MTTNINTTLALDDYIKDIIGKGDEGSALLAKLTAPTLKNCKYVDVLAEGMNGIAVLKNLPMTHDVVVYSIGGDPDISDLEQYTRSMPKRLFEIAQKYHFTPLAFANVIDASIGDKPDIELIGRTLRASADSYGWSILNGELAILGNRVRVKANINGTMIALAPKIEMSINRQFMLNYGDSGVRATSFNHEGKPVWINSDGIGTKTDFYERRGFKLRKCLNDSLAMKLDDTIKIGATAKVVSDVVEWKDIYNDGSFPYSRDEFENYAEKLSNEYGIEYILQFEHMEDRIRGHTDSAASLNVSGSVVSIIDEERLKNPPKPNEGDYLIAISGHPNPRSNGITDKRKMMIKLFGERYHETEIGKIFLEYLAAPSIVLYPHFKHLIDNNLATSVYHMSGGAYKSKLAKPLAKHGLFVCIEDLFAPDWRELALAGANFTSAEAAYEKWPMGNDGFVTTRNPKEVISYLENHGLKGRMVGQLKVSYDVTNNVATKRTGVELTAFNGQKVYYSGR